MQRAKQLSTLTQKAQGIKCRYCASHEIVVSVTYKVYSSRFSAAIAKIACERCRHTVTIAKVNGTVVAQCPKCGLGATLAVGKSGGGAPYRFRFVCDNPRCDWEASAAFMWAYSDLLRFLDAEGVDA